MTRIDEIAARLEAMTVGTETAEIADITYLLARVRKLEAVLRPFANFGLVLKEHKPLHYPDTLWQYNCGHGACFSLLQSELKAAHDALEDEA